MATTWYFHEAAPGAGPTTKASTDTDSFSSSPSDKDTMRSMDANVGSSQTTGATVASSGSSPLYSYDRIFVGPAMSAQTLTGGQSNYSVSIAINESSSKMNVYNRIFVYIWRSGSGNVKTIISPTSCSTEHGAGEYECVITATGASGDFSILENDRIVVETWFDIRNTRKSSYTATHYYDGTDTSFTDGSTTSDAGSNFYCPQTLLLPTERRIFVTHV